MSPSLFEQTHEKYEREIYELILRVVNDREAAEELTVETFTTAWRAWDRFRGETPVAEWLHKVAIRCCKEWMCRNDKGFELERELGELEQMLGLKPPASRASPDQMQRAVDSLLPEYRIVLVLAEREDMSYETIAQITGLTVPAVKTRLHRARAMVRRRLAAHNEEE